MKALLRIGPSFGSRGVVSSIRRPYSQGKYDHDVIVVGGGSGGIACAREASKLGANVGLYDFVKESPQGTTWGLGGTCVNVGCIPKKLFHHASLLGEAIQDAEAFGWSVKPKEIKSDWKALSSIINNHVKSLNFGYRVDVRENNIKYYNEFARFVDPHTIEGTNKKGEKTLRTAKNIVVAVGERPHLPKGVEGIEHAITSDDIFTLQREPGDTLIVGGGYVALETAGFLQGLGFKSTVMVRSILLRGFDQQMAEKIGDHMASLGTRFIRPAVPLRIDKLPSGKLRVTYRMGDGEQAVTGSEDFDTVMIAAGRKPLTHLLNLEAAGVKMSQSGKIIADPYDKTTQYNVFAIGDCALGRPELTPTAILSGKLLARRLVKGSLIHMDYSAVPTTVFTPIEYSCVGLSEEDAIQKYGAKAIEVYHSYFTPLEHTIPHLFDPNKPENICYVKVICLKEEDERVVGMHIFSPNSAEIIQGFSLAIQKKLTKYDLDHAVSIHPTIGEELMLLKASKSSGEDPVKRGC